MFEKKDYLEYLTELHRIEIEMSDLATGLKHLFTDERITGILDKISGDEVRHARLVDDLSAIIDKNL